MISVVIPLYNKEKAVRATLESVLAQTYTDYEIVIVNDGSTDNSVAVCEDIINSLTPSFDNSLRIFSKPNGGVSSARNFGVEKSRGEYVAFLDGDDLWEPTYLEEAAKLIQDFSGAAIYGLGLGCMTNGEKHPAAEFVPSGYRGVVSNLWNNPNTMLAWTSSSSICPRELLLKTPANTQLTHGEDLDQWLRLMLQGDAVFFNKTLAYYVKDAENRAMYKMPPIERHIVSVIGDYAEARKSNAQFRKAFDTQMIYFLYQYLFTPYKKEAQRLAELLDYSQLKRSLHFRMKYPRLYRMYERVKELKSE
ncbi:MAG: glycosyltransferase family 2 protein [Paludibacteraceae bacterium]|nr:glycosyltransferase family 2 protein [Paludibacteraceae bacterium]MBQ6724261.1 glycosyltransferase family 2 protein [Paludibacteraceae bacterium]